MSATGASGDTRPNAIQTQTILFVGIGEAERHKGAQQMLETLPAKTTEFKDGDNVVLAEGTYQGTPGVFIRLRPDVNWAEIRERNGLVRCHPVVWLQHAGLPGNPAS